MANWSDPRMDERIDGRTGAAAFASRRGPAPSRPDMMLACVRTCCRSTTTWRRGCCSPVSSRWCSPPAVIFRVLFNPLTGKPSLLGWIVSLAPLGIVFAMSFGQQRMATGTLKAFFWGFAVLMGLSLSTIFIAYTGSSIAGAFFATAAGFAGLSLWGYTTKRDLSPMGTFLMVGLVGLIVASLLAIWLPGLNMVVSIVGVLIFAGLTAYDTQRIKSQYDYVAGTPQVDRVVVMSALSLYLDFINMFLFVLRLFGSRN